MEKRVVFRSAGCPGCCSRRRWWSSLVFFFWPAGQALLQSLQQQDAFGTSTEWVGLENFERPVQRPELPRVVQDHGGLLGPGGRARPRASRCCWRCSPTASCAARCVYKTLLIWPYAVAPAVAGVLWLFMFAPSHRRRRRTRCAEMGIDWNHLLNANHAMALIVMAAVWKQISYNFLFFLAGLQSIPQVADRGGGDRRRPAVAALLDASSVPAAVADHLLPARDQRRLRLLRHLRHRRRGDPGRPGQGHRDPGLQGLLRRLQGAGPRRLGGAVGGADGDRHRAHGRPVPLRREEGATTEHGRAPPRPRRCCRTWC